MNNTGSEYTDRVAVVTGAAVGIGLDIAEQLAAQGARVVINDLDKNALEAAVNAVKSNGGRCVGVAGDCSDLDVMDLILARAYDEFGQLDYVVANAGITTFGEFLHYTPDDFQRLISVNLFGTFFLAQKAARLLIRHANGGRIILMSSVTGIQYHPDLTAYGMSKGAIRMLVKSLGVELAGHGITVNGIAPGAIATPRTVSDPDYEATWSKLNPNRRVGTVGDISRAALFLLSDGAAHMTSQTLVVDGGWSAVSPSCLLYTSPSPRDLSTSRMPSSA